MNANLTFEEMRAQKQIAENFIKQIVSFDEETIKAMKVFFAGMDFQKTISGSTNSNHSAIT